MVVVVPSSSGGLSRTDMPCLDLQVITRRWFMVFASFLIVSAAGATYMFGVYSSNIKSSLGYDQTTLNLLSFFKDVGANFGVLSCLINEVTQPWVVLFMAQFETDEAMDEIRKVLEKSDPFWKAVDSVDFHGQTLLQR